MGDLCVDGIDIVDDVEHPCSLRVALPIGDEATVRAPTKTIPARKLLLIDPVGDDGVGVAVGVVLAGVGDPIFWGTVRPVFAALGAGIAMSGSLLGPLLFFILFNLVRLATRYYGVAYGYSKGIDIVKDMGGGFLQKLTEGASILGLFVMGALVNKWTHVNIPLVVSRITDQTGKEHVTTVQTILDQLMPGLVPLLLTFACMWLLRKKVNPLWIIVGFFVIGIAGYACGLLGL